MSVEDGIPEAGQATEQIHDWEKDYKALQAEYTRTQQAYKAETGVWDDPEAALARLRERQPDLFEDDTPEPGNAPDPTAALRAEIAARDARLDRLEAAENARNQEAGRKAWEGELNGWAATDGVKLTKADLNAIAWEASRENDPVAATRGIYDQHVADKKAEIDALKAEIEAERKRPRVPHTVTGGQPGTGVKAVEDMTRAELNRHMAQQLAEA